MITNTKSVYAEYISGHYCRYHATEADAIASVNDPTNGAEFCGEWCQAAYSEYLPGTLCLHNFKEGAVCAIGDRDSSEQEPWFIPAEKVAFAFGN